MKRLVLLGGGHAHLFVLEAFARQRPDIEVILITPDALTPYSGMMPGVIAGHYRYRQACIDLAPLAGRAGCTMRLDAAVGLDATRKQLHLAGGTTLDYDLLSVDTGSTPRLPDVPGATQHGHPVKPIGGLLRSWQSQASPRSVAVVGAGAAGIEIVMALRHCRPELCCTLLDRSARILDGLPSRLCNMVASELQRQHIHLIAGARIERIDEASIKLGDGRVIASDFSVWATGASPADWLDASGLALDARGFILTGPTLQSISHPDVFAAGDVATMTAFPRPRSGVFAVRAGPSLAANLMRRASGKRPQPWHPQQRALMILACGRRHAIAAHGALVLKGDWVWCWKDRIDRGFVRRFDPLADQS